MRKHAIAAALIVGVSAGRAGADPSSIAPQVDELDIASIPFAAVLNKTDQNGNAAYEYVPEVSACRDIGGVAVIECRIASVKGDLDECVVLAEAPRGCFFGAASRRLAQVRIIGAPQSYLREPDAVGKVIRVKVKFPGREQRPGFRC